RTNDELVAGWGNLVNRTANLLHKNIGEIPEPGDLNDTDRQLLATTKNAFTKVGELIGSHRQRQAINEAMRTVAEANKYLSDSAPWKLKDSDPARMRTILHVATQAIDDCNTLLAPFLPHAAQTVHEVFGGQDTVSPMPRIEEVTDLDDPNSQYPIVTGDYRLATESEKGTIRPWASQKITTGRPIAAPTPIFKKLDDSIVEDELARLAEQL
ncbi:MAG TPA: class I tRNA ligase family protein, partial [Actinomycetales bacterium]|nr:class I tRNA ligase family protein [Actinomycetales bacterium]